MRFIIFLILTGALAATSAAQPASKFAALAVDRNNGFYFGWSFDHPTLEASENRALEECKKKGGTCSVVLVFSGNGCGAYRTVPSNVGTAYGWGTAPTRAVADQIAQKEAQKRSGGRAASNFVYACNTTTEPLKIIRDEKYRTVRIGNQSWIAQDLDVDHFRNGDPVPLATSAADWAAAHNAKKPMSAYYEYKTDDPKKLGRMYNYFAIDDPRGLAPAGFRIASKEDWERLFVQLGDPVNGARKILSRDGWPAGYGTGTDDFGFTAMPTTLIFPDGTFRELNGLGSTYWTSTQEFRQTYKRIAPLYVGFLIRYPKLTDRFGSPGDWSRGLPTRAIKE